MTAVYSCQVYFGHLVKLELVSFLTQFTVFLFRSVPRIFKKIISPDYKGIVALNTLLNLHHMHTPYI